MTKIEKLIIRANELESKLNIHCQSIAELIQKKIKFTNDIHCFFQPSDGFVIMVDLEKNDAPENIPLSYFIETWKDHIIYTVDDLRYLK